MKQLLRIQNSSDLHWVGNGSNVGTPEVTSMIRLPSSAMSLGVLAWSFLRPLTPPGRRERLPGKLENRRSSERVFLLS